MAKKKMIKPARKCIWCGGGDLSKEHIWSEWTHGIVPPVPGGSHTRMTTIRSPANPTMLGHERATDKQGSTNTIRIRAVCRSCNHGWMNDLETLVRPILGPLILAQPFAVNLSSAKIMARWATMKIMVAEHSQIDDVVSLQAERDHLRLNREPPSTWTIWIAHHSGGPKWRGGYARTSNTMGLPGEPSPPLREDGTLAKNTQAVTFGIGYLLFVAVSTQVLGLDFDIPPGFRSYFRRIWPLEGDFLWRPGKILSQGGVDMVARAFVNLERHPNIRWLPKPS